MKKITSITVILLLLLALITTNTSGLEKNYRWIKIPVYGGVISSISQGSNNQLYCSTMGDGIYTIGTDHWDPVENEILPDYVYFVLEWDDTVFCGTDQFLYVKSPSEDWKKVSTHLSNERIRAKQMSVASSRDNDVLLLSTNRGLYKSFDQGITWILDSTITVPVYTVAVNPSKQSQIIVSAGNGHLFMSNDYGIEWIEIKNDKVYGKIISLSIDRDNEKILYAGTPEKGVYISKDGGHTWKSESENLSNLYVSFIQQTDQGIFCGTYGGLHTYHVKDSRWEKMGDNLLNANITTGLYFEKNKTWIVGTNGSGIHTLDDTTKKWTPLNEHITNLHVRSFEQDSKGETILLGTWGGGVYRSFDNGKSWKPSNKGLKNPYILCIERINDAEYLVGTFNGGIYKSNDAGLSWESLQTSSIFTKYIYSLKSLPTNTDTIYCGTNGNVYKTNNAGRDWTKLSLGSFENPIGNITDIAINPENENEIFVSTDETGLYSSKNAGKEWYFSGKGIENRHITSVVYHPLYANTLFCTTIGSGVFCSVDNGNSWGACNEGLGSNIVYCLSSNDTNKEEFLVGTETGIYRRKTMEDPWEEFGHGLQGLRVRSIIKNLTSDSYFVGTDQKGLFRNVHFPNVPMPMSPKNNERITTLRPTFLWTETTEVTIPYTFSLRVMDSSQKTIYEKDHISGDQFIVPANILSRYNTYHWTVRAESFAGNTQWSKPYSFTVIGQIVLQINEPLMTVNGKIVEIDPGRNTTPIIRENRTFLPIRSVVESFGGTVTWEPTARSIVLDFMENTIQLQLMNPIATKNGESIQIDPDNENVTPFIQNERTMIPLRFVAESLDIDIQWNATEREIILEYPRS